MGAYMRKTILITGASSGIGASCAFKLAEKKHRLILAARRADRIQQLCDELSTITDVHPLIMDVRNREQVFSIIKALPAAWEEIDVLINNAGLAVGLSHLHEGHPDDWDRMIDTNIKGVLNVLKAVTPGMIRHKKGHIVQISSIASKEVYPNGNVYCATKHALDAITQGIRMELLPYHIRVTSIHPGMVETEFSLVRFKGDKARADAVYSNVEPLSADDVAEVIVYSIELPSHVSLHEAVVMPSAQAGARMMRKKDGSI